MGPSDRRGARRRDLGLVGDKLAERLATGDGDGIPPEPLAAVDEPFGLELAERLADRDPADGVRGRELGFARQELAGWVGARREFGAQVAGEGEVAEVSSHGPQSIRQVRYSSATR